MAKWSAKRIKMPLKYKWNISRGECIERVNLFISYEDGQLSGIGEVAFMTHEGPSIEEIELEFSQFLESVPKDINGLEDMMAVFENLDFELSPNLRFGIESAYVHFLASLLDGNVQNVLGVETVTKAQTSYSLPILKSGEYTEFIKLNKLNRFSALKIKVNGVDCLPLLEEISEAYDGSLWLDANESFQNANETLSFIENIKKYNIDLIEQPLKRDMFEDSIFLKTHNDSGIKLIADESLTNGVVHAGYCDAYDGVNIKLMKAGGYFSALRQMREAKPLKLKVMVGCMLESSLGIYSALNILEGANYIDLDSVLFFEKDPFNLVFEESGQIQYSQNQ